MSREIFVKLLAVFCVRPPRIGGTGMPSMLGHRQTSSSGWHRMVNAARAAPE
ncbi:MAG: hypothetical protein M3N49_07540 [Candidatus Eremiobacteraeota bacterium]|nr:hypothetical protein [Candidatus Eremiobacteraeota bacterium]